MNQKLKAFIYAVGTVAGTSLVGLATTNKMISPTNEEIKTKIEYQAPCPFGELPSLEEESDPHKRYPRTELGEIIPAVYECLPNKPSYMTQELVESIVDHESEYNNHAISPVGARGLIQMMEPTWKERTKALYGKELSFDLAFVPRINLETGLNYVVWLDKYAAKRHPNWKNLSEDEKIGIVTAAYHGGPVRLDSLNWNVARMGPQSRKYSGGIVKSLMN